MKLKCLLGLHDWQGCKCRTCGNTRHVWNGCKCATCGAIRDSDHDWQADCERCSQCSQTRANAHSWRRRCKCVTCGKTGLDGHQWDKDTLYRKCRECGTIREQWRKSISRGALIIDLCEEGDLDSVATHLAQGADVNASRTCDGETALMRLCDSEKRSDREKIADLLIGAGANVKAQNFEGHTALHWAAFHGETELVSRLISAGADVNAQTRDGRTAAAVAQQWCSHNKDEVLALLFQRGASRVQVKRFEVFGIGSDSSVASQVSSSWLAANGVFDATRAEAVFKQDDGTIQSGIRGRLDYLQAHYTGNQTCVWREIALGGQTYWLLIVS